jgi:hypothetical protein
LSVVRDQFVLKYGKELNDNCNNYSQDYVNPRVIHKLSITTPDPKLVKQYLNVIAQAFNVEFNQEIVFYY